MKIPTIIYFPVFLVALVNADYDLECSTKHHLYRTRHVDRGLKIKVYHPPTRYETFGEGLIQTNSVDEGNLPAKAKAFIQSKLGIDQGVVTFKSGYTSAIGTYAYVKQTHEGVPFVNAVANIAWKGDRVVSFGSSFVQSRNIANSTPSITVEVAILKAEEILGGIYNGHPTTVEYLARDDGSVSLVHTIQIQDAETGSWCEAYVDAHAGEFISLTDFVSYSSYTVVPINKKSPAEGIEVVHDPEDFIASPFGWHATSTTNFTTTSGNNVAATGGTTGGPVPQSSVGLNFNYLYNQTQPPTTSVNMNAAIVNGFYVINSIHDVAYRYGFSESNFNFQLDNFGKGGASNDRVLFSIQNSASGTDNSNFATPPDGQSGQCRMFIWTATTPNRNGALENDIVIHEMAHGITNRMTGGGTARCLQTTESGGLGEGWSDAMANWNWQKSATTVDFVVGDWVANNTAGLRTYPYSTSGTTNPLRYSSIKTLTDIHAIGEVWANILHNVYAALVGGLGFDGTARTNPSSAAGNAVFLHLFMDALRLQPCNPTFVNARDAWIQADSNRYGGTNKCTLWRAFASRGLGLGAVNFNDSGSVPAGC